MTDLSDLTPRQWEVAGHIADGLSDRQIAALLHVTCHTVRRHIERIQLVWRLDATRNLRVQIALRVTRHRDKTA